jgi:hypothetical protein
MIVFLPYSVFYNDLQFEHSEEITMLFIANVKKKSPKTITHKTLILHISLCCLYPQTTYINIKYWFLLYDNYRLICN